MSLVIDANIYLSTALMENNLYSSEVIKYASENELDIFVPELFDLEVSNIIIQAVKKKVLRPEHLDDYIKKLEIAPFERVKPSLKEVARLASDNHLTIYDATYLEVALKTKSKLATLDKDLKKTALKLDIFCNLN